MKFTEERLEQAIIELLGSEDVPHVHGGTLSRVPEEVLIKADAADVLPLISQRVIDDQ